MSIQKREGVAINTESIKKAGRALWTGAQIVLKCALLLPIPLFIIWLNFESAEAAAYRENQFERDCAKALLSGQPLEGFDQLDERLILTQLVENLEEPFDTVALGSSRILQLTEALADGGSFYNCGLSGADYRDIMNVFYLFDKADKLPQNLILGLDPWLLNADPLMLHGQSDAELFEEFITVKLGYQTDYIPQPEDTENPLDYLDPVAFRQNVAYLGQDAPQDVPAPVVEGDICTRQLQVKMPDGTTLYPKDFRDADLEKVNARALTEATTFLRMDDYAAPDEALCLLFHRFVQYAESRGVNVIFVMLPYHPLVYTYATEHADYYTGFFLTEPWFAQYASMYGIPLYGSYNPFVTNTHKADFYDGLHIRGEVIPSVFPGVQATRAQQAQGAAGSPWVLNQRPRVTWESAEYLVMERYDIPETEPRSAGHDVVIRGELCYVVERYSSAAPDAIRLARYAVSRREGIIYRWDTDMDQWLVDAIFTD